MKHADVTELSLKESFNYARTHLGTGKAPTEEPGSWYSLPAPASH